MGRDRPPAPPAEAALRSYLALLRRWNARMDLVAPDTDEAWWDAHVMDALGALAILPPGPARVLDVGSGAGLPGLVWSLARPELRVTLLEPRAKRTSFLRAAVRETGASASVVRGRTEDVEAASWDVVVGRAVAPYASWLRLAAPLARPGGRVVALLTATDPEGWGVAEAETGLELEAVVPYRLPVSGAPRRVAALERLASGDTG